MEPSTEAFRFPLTNKVHMRDIANAWDRSQLLLGLVPIGEVLLGLG